MEFFKWKESFNIGIEDIDHQHKSFLALLNTWHTKQSDCNLSGIDPEMIASLRGYVSEHFRFEEELMRSKFYPDLERQQKQHKLFESEISKLESDFAAGKYNSIESIFVSMQDWFLTPTFNVKSITNLCTLTLTYYFCKPASVSSFNICGVGVHNAKSRYKN